MNVSVICERCVNRPKSTHNSIHSSGACSDCRVYSNFKKEIKVVNFPIKHTGNEEIAGRINDGIAANEIEGLAAVVKNKDGTFEIQWSKSLSYLELLGMLEQAKLDLFSRANDII